MIRPVMALMAMVALFVPNLAHAQGQGAPLGTLGVSASNTSYVGTVDVSPSIPFTFYVWAEIDFGQIGQPDQNTSNGIKGWEAQLSIPAEMFILSTTLEPPDALNFGDVPGEFIIGTGQLVRADTGVALASIQALVTSAVTDVTISLSGTSPSSVDPPQPMWLEWLKVNGCTLSGGGPTNCKRPFATLRTLTINPTQPPTKDIVEVSAEATTASTGSLFHVPVTATSVAVPAKRVGDLGDLAGFDLDLSWDASVAQLNNVTLAPALSNWYVEFNNSVPGEARISAAAPTGTAVTTVTRELLDLEFQASSVPGQTSLSFTKVTLWDSKPELIESRSAPGSITVTECDLYDPFDDGTTNAADAIVTLQFATGLTVPSTAEFCAADIDGSGDITSGDAVRILRRAVGNEKSPALSSGPGYVALEAEPSTSEVLLRLESLAGADLVLQYDAVTLDFLGIDPELSAQVVVNDREKGVLRIGLAAPAEISGLLRIRFDANSVGRVRLESVEGFDARGRSKALERGESAVELSPTTAAMSRVARFVGIAPNPFNPSTTFRYSLPGPGEIRFRIHDASGRLIREILVEANGTEGAVRWDGLDQDGRFVASGVYYVQMVSGAQTSTRRAVLLK